MAGQRRVATCCRHRPRRFSAVCGLDGIEAVSSAPVLAQGGYIAPDGVHLAAQRRAPDTCRIVLMQTPPLHFCLSSADPMIISLATAYGENLLAVILTGMGKDGLTGCQYVAAAGGTRGVQDAPGRGVWGIGLSCRALAQWLPGDAT